MADGFTIGIEGLAELEKTLTDLSTKRADAAVRKALKAGAAIEQAAIVEHFLSRRKPKEQHRGGLLPEGAIENDIVVKMSRDEDGGIIAIVGPDKYTKTVARLVEYGHRIVTGGYNKLNRATGKARGPGKVHAETVDASPFIRPAFEESRQEVANTMATVLAEEITKAASKP
jgi:HK97 gp10 family phage protein